MKMKQSDFLDLIREEMEALTEGLQKANIGTIPEQKSGVKKEAEEFLLVLPKFTPTESWGSPSHEARKEIESYVKRIPGRGIEQKLQALARLQEPDNRITSPRRIISTLILLESLASVLTSFSSSATGFVFEGFLAALLGGRQIADPLDGSLPIEDIVAYEPEEPIPGVPSKGVPMSLKVLSPGVDIKGSYTNLVDAMNRFEQVVYVVAVKTGGTKDPTAGLEIATFIIDRENVIDLVARNNKHLLEPKPNPSFYDFDKKHDSQDTVDFYKKQKSWKDRYNLLRDTVGYTRKVNEAKGGVQWHVTQPQITKDMRGVLKYTPIATLNLKKEDLLAATEKYMDQLRGSILELFQAVKSLSSNLNDYFSSDRREVALKKGIQAVKDAQRVEDSMQKQIEKDKD
tara:strand:- start:45 stop:1244 length:1200 start_codon:yes stop_codon:yes gene_type:complete